MSHYLVGDWLTIWVIQFEAKARYFFFFVIFLFSFSFGAMDKEKIPTGYENGATVNITPYDLLLIYTG